MLEKRKQFFLSPSFVHTRIKKENSIESKCPGNIAKQHTYNQAKQKQRGRERERENNIKCV